MKKVISILLTVCVLISITACSGKQKTGSEGGVPVINWLVPGDNQPDLASVMGEVNKITEEKIGAKLELQFIDVASFGERMKMNMAAGSNFDLCFTGFVNDYVAAVNNGGLMDITEMVEARPELKKAIPDFAWSAATIQEKIWGVPNQQIMATKLSLVIDKEIADKYDFDWSKVTHIRDIEPFLEMVKEGEPGRYPFRTDYGTTPWTNPVYENLSGEFVLRRDGSSNKIVPIHQTEEFNEALHTLRKWYVNGYIRKDVLSANDDSTDFKAGKYVVFVTTTKPGSKEILEAQLGRRLLTVDITEPYLTKSSALATMISVGANSKNAEKAVDFIELVNTDKELYNLICFGVKDKHYSLNEEGKVVYIENSGYAPKADWKFGNQFNALLTEGLADDVWIETDRLNREAAWSPLLEFQIDTDPIKTEISQFTAVRDEFSAMTNGADDPDNYLDDFIKKCKSAGQDRIGEELQRQIDEFFENK